MTNILSPSEAKRLSQEDKAGWTKFMDKHFHASEDTLTKVLKTHLYIENLINEILNSSFPNSNKLLTLKFSRKIDLIEAMNDYSGKIIKPLRALNHIRNKYAHDLNYKPTEQEITDLCHIIKDTNKHSMQSGMLALLTYLHAVKTITKSLPYLTACIRSEKLFALDKGFKLKEIINSYGAEVFVFLESMKI